jgi:hypothetical protein
MSTAGQSRLWPAAGRHPRGPFKALTLSPPWAWCMVRLQGLERKVIENRDWYPWPDLLEGEWFCLHQGIGWDDGCEEWIIRAIGRPPPSREELAEAGDLGAILAFARLLRVVRHFDEVFPEIHQARWLKSLERHPKNQGWWLEIHPIPEPIPAKGAHKLWSVPEELGEAVETAYRKVGLAA